MSESGPRPPILLDFDDLLPDLGTWGRYQKTLYFLINIAAAIHAPFQYMLQIFISGVPDYWCQMPVEELSAPPYNLSAEESKQLLIPLVMKDGYPHYSKCTRYSAAANITAYLPPLGNLLTAAAAAANGTAPHGSTAGFLDILAVNKSEWREESCDQWQYDNTWYDNTYATEWDIVCDKSDLIATAYLFFNLGNVLGTPIFGYLSDRIGRRKTFFVCLGCNLVFSTLTAVAWNYESLCVTRFLTGLTMPSAFQIPLIIALEFLGPKEREMATMAACILFSFGNMLIGGLAFAVREWRHLVLATSLPFVLLIGYWWYLPESVRWLLARGHIQEAEKIVQNIARWNKKQLPANYLESMLEKKERLMTEEKQATSDQSTSVPLAVDTNVTMVDLFRTSNMRKKTIIITFCWCADVIVYAGLSYSSIVLGTRNPYLTFIISAIVEIPGYLLAWSVVNRLGRKWPYVAFMITAGTALLLSLIAPGNYWFIIIINMVAKFAISAAFGLLYLWTVELYPTVIRGNGFGFSEILACTVAILVPYVVYLAEYSVVLPLVIMGGISLANGLACIFLPETANQPVPNTVEEGEQFGKYQPICYWGFRNNQLPSATHHEMNGYSTGPTAHELQIVQ